MTGIADKMVDGESALGNSTTKLTSETVSGQLIPSSSGPWIQQSRSACMLNWKDFLCSIQGSCSLSRHFISTRCIFF